MYNYHAYKLMTDTLAVKGVCMPFDVNRSTVWRWRAAGRVPELPFKTLYFFVSACSLAHGWGVDLLDQFGILGFDTTGLPPFPDYSTDYQAV